MSAHPGGTLPVRRARSQVSLANLGLSFAGNTGGLVLTGEKNKRIPCSGKTKYNFHGLLLDGRRDCGTLLEVSALVLRQTPCGATAT